MKSIKAQKPLGKTPAKTKMQSIFKPDDTIASFTNGCKVFHATAVLQPSVYGCCENRRMDKLKYDLGITIHPGEAQEETLAIRLPYDKVEDLYNMAQDAFFSTECEDPSPEGVTTVKGDPIPPCNNTLANLKIQPNAQERHVEHLDDGGYWKVTINLGRIKTPKSQLGDELDTPRQVEDAASGLPTVWHRCTICLMKHDLLGVLEGVIKFQEVWRTERYASIIRRHKGDQFFYKIGA